MCFKFLTSWGAFRRALLSTERTRLYSCIRSERDGRASDIGANFLYLGICLLKRDSGVDHDNEI